MYARRKEQNFLMMFRLNFNLKTNYCIAYNIFTTSGQNLLIIFLNNIIIRYSDN